MFRRPIHNQGKQSKEERNKKRKLEVPARDEESNQSRIKKNKNASPLQAAKKRAHSKAYLAAMQEAKRAGKTQESVRLHAYVVYVYVYVHVHVLHTSNYFACNKL